MAPGDQLSSRGSILTDSSSRTHLFTTAKRTWSRSSCMHCQSMFF